MCHSAPPKKEKNHQKGIELKIMRIDSSLFFVLLLPFCCCCCCVFALECVAAQVALENKPGDCIALAAPRPPDPLSLSFPAIQKLEQTKNTQP